MDVQSKDDTLDERSTGLAVSESGYRGWKQGGKPDRTRLTDAQMLAWIRAIHDELKEAYGAREWSESCVGVGSLLPSREWND
jgi:hypothetical protein